MKKQFDLSHIKVDDRLQGAHLAPFPNRFFAYLIDWLLIFLASEFTGVAILLLILVLLLRQKFNASLTETRQLIDTNLAQLDQKLESYEIEEQLRRRFSKMLTVAIYTSMALMVVIPLLTGIAMMVHLVMPEWVEPYLGSLRQANVFSSTLDEMNMVVGFIAKFIGAILYFSFFTWRWNGQTPGKRLFDIRVVKLNGTPLSLFDSFERVSGYASSASLLLIGFFQYFWDKNHQTTHDKLSETIVIIGQLPQQIAESKQVAEEMAEVMN